MRNLVLILFFVGGFILIWSGHLRLMFTGVFLVLDAIGGQIYINTTEIMTQIKTNFEVLDERMIRRLTEINQRIDSLETDTKRILDGVR